MKALKINKVINEDGILILDDIPVKRGEEVEVILLLDTVNDKDKILELAGLMTEEEANEFESVIREGKTIKNGEVRL